MYENLQCHGKFAAVMQAHCLRARSVYLQEMKILIGSSCISKLTQQSDDYKYSNRK